MRKLLVVCHGNICRSPMAQVVFQHKLPRDWCVESAGLGALVDQPAAPEALCALQAIGMDASGHRARQLHPDMLRDAEMVLVMEMAQKDELERIYPWVRGRVFRLGHWEKTEIDDPYRGSQKVFDRSMKMIELCCTSWCERLT